MRYQNKTHLGHIRGMVCALFDYSVECIGATEVHHLLKPWHGSRGMGLKANDRNVIPLCHYHHAMLHDQRGNEDSYWTEFQQQISFGRDLALMLWMRSPHYETGESHV